ncbi:hypothetical protein PT974_01703 [Cladobotryum mycophilum]|uniref:Uncharacterized protein n=1 Tax=Cladobotryum mycophilum TaxID=491253 RepID=A0ABR0SW99_9HYPO
MSHSRPEQLRNFTPHGVVNVEELRLSNDIFRLEPKEFLFCLICGTTQRFAKIMLQEVELVTISWENVESKGNLLTLVASRFAEKSDDLILSRSFFANVQGLQLLAKDQNGQSMVVGRTVIPKELPRVTAENRHQFGSDNTVDQDQ